MSKKNDEINTFDIELPQNLDLLLDIETLLKDTKIIDQLKKLTCKYVKEEEEPKKQKWSNRVITQPPNPFMPPGRGGIPSGGPSPGFGQGGFMPGGGINDIDPFGGSNLIGPSSSMFNSGRSNKLRDPDDPSNFPGPFGFGAPPDNDEFPPGFGGGKKGGGPGGPSGGFGGFGGFGGGGGTSGGNFYM
jgi:hypothetical protein